MGSLYFLIFYTSIALTAYISYDQGQEIRFSYLYSSSFVCNNKVFTYTTPFNGEFKNKPQVVVSAFQYDTYVAPLEFIFNISDITTKGRNVIKKDFTSYVECLSHDFFGVRFDWTAIDDERVEVLNFFVTNMSSFQNHQFTTTHNNFNINQGFITIMSFGFLGDMRFNLTISSITETQVIYQYTSTNQNLLSLGFQIVLGTDGTFTSTEIYRLNAYSINATTNYYDTGFIPVSSNQMLNIPYSGMNHRSNMNIRMNRNTLFQNSSGIQYSYFSYGSGKPSIELYSQNVLFSKNNPKIINPYICKKMRISQLQSITLLSSPISIKFVEIGQTFNTDTYQEYFWDKTKQLFTVNAFFKCTSNKKVVGQILKCIECNQQVVNINQNCYGPNNVMNISITFYQPDKIYQKIQVNITSSYFTMTQTVTNKVQQSYVLATLALINQ